MKKRVVVVEDDDSIRDILQIILEREGYSTITCTNGYEILNGNVEVPDLYMIDRHLSGVDGLEICKYLKMQEASSKIPIIVLSATAGIENVVRSVGANAFIEKPFSRKQLVETIASVVSNGQL